MVETTVELDEAHVEGLRRLAAQTGQSEDVLLRAAIDRLLPREDRLTRLQRSFGA
jgi:predicted transcriptional regulator